MKKLLAALVALLAIEPAFAQTPTTPAIAAMVCANNTVVPTPVNGQFFYVQCDSSGHLLTNASGGGGTPGGSSGQVQYNNAGAFGGITGATTNGTTLTLVAPVLGTPASGVATNLTGTAAGLTAGNVTTNANLTGDVTSVGNATTLTNAPVIAKVLTGYTSAAGTVSATDSILQAFQKLNGNDGLKLPLAGGTMGGTILFSPDGSFDIGASGATRPRNIFINGSLVATTDVSVGGTRFIGFTGRSFFSSSADSNMMVANNANTAFNLFQFGGTTSSFPAIKRSTTTLAIRLADDSADAPLTASNLTASGNIVANGAASVVTPKGYIVSTLPASPATGSIAYVTDAVACTFLAALTGGSSTYCPVTYNGAAWVGG